VDPGQIVQPGRALFVFAATGPTQLVGLADEKFLSQLAPGQPARVVADAFPQQPFDARLARLAPGVDVQRGTVEVKFDVPAPPPFLREDMTLSMQVVTSTRERALTLPATAVIGAGIDARVRTVVDGRIVERPIRTGLRTLERVEVTDGMTVGEAVLAEPLSSAPGARVRIARDDDPIVPRAAAVPATSGGAASSAAMGGR
jgi:HlyD family secretion protein